jgi:hypothetical protein
MSRAFLALLVLDALILYLKEDSQEGKMAALRRARAAMQAMDPGALGLDPSG